jgi:CRISPR-associated protein Csc2
MNIESFTEAIDSGTVNEIQNRRQNRHTHILVLREVTAPARFTTDGETVNTTPVRVGNESVGTEQIRAVDLFYRKQPGAERRIAKSVQRDLLGQYEVCADDYMHPNEMRQNSPESVLFGSAAGNKSISQRSRVYYNSAYTLRDASAVIRQNTQNASGDQARVQSEEGQGTWTPDFVMPGAVFPSVVTLDSTIPEEVLFVLAVLARTTRYGANESRGGNVTNHVLGVFAGHGDGPANLEIVRETVAELVESDQFDSLEAVIYADTLETPTIATAVRAAYDRLCSERGLTFDAVDRDDVEAVVALLRDDETLTEIMERQYEEVQDYIGRFESND